MSGGGDGRSRRRWTGLVAAMGLVALWVAPAGVGVPGAASAAAVPGGRGLAAEEGQGAQPAGCARPSVPGAVRCDLSTEPVPAPQVAAAHASSGSCPVNGATGWTPCNLQSAYELTAASASAGAQSTVAVVDAYDDPDAESDLAVYRSTYGLPACTTANGCFRKVNESGEQGDYPMPLAAWAGEVSLDVDMVSAICPKCKILLVEATTLLVNDLGASVSEAVSLGATAVSASWGEGEWASETSDDSYFDHPGVPVAVASGDGAYSAGVQWPAASPYVTAVGGTELLPAGDRRGWAERAWATPNGTADPAQGSGSGCSAYEPKPTWQTDTGCGMRMVVDVSAVAADVTAYNSYQSGGWFAGYGTSASAPIIAAVYGLAASPTAHAVAIPAATTWGLAPGKLHDILTGSTGACTPSYFCQSGRGYDGPTGLGTPRGIGAFRVKLAS